MSAVGDKVKAIYDRRLVALYALNEFYAAKALKLFREDQKNYQIYWENQTSQAVDSVFSGVIKDNDFIGFFLAHGKDYGVYLELANNRQNEALKPIMDSLYQDYIKDVKAIYV